VSLPKNVTWITKEPKQKEFALSGIKFSNDSVLVREGKTSAMQTSFTNQTKQFGQLVDDSSKIIPLPPDTLRVIICADPDFKYDEKIILASLRTIEKTIPIVIKTSSVVPAENKPRGNEYEHSTFQRRP
jgi:hypothetical protein